MLLQPFFANRGIAEYQKQYAGNANKYKCQIYSHSFYSFVLLDNLNPTHKVANTIDMPNK